jgi:CDP-diacylglycerol--glycerol-3-phosphate 3-phosphatidyltransferase
VWTAHIHTGSGLGVEFAFDYSSNYSYNFPMLENRYKHIFEKPLSSLAEKIYISPDAITVTGFIMTIIASVTIAHNLFWGGVLILVAGFFDMIDGAVARAHNTFSDFGAFLDSVLDRYSDSFIFLGFTAHFFTIQSTTGIWLSLGTMVGALLVSYTRARAEGLGKECKVGLMERPERVLLLAFAALTGWVQPVMGILFILTHGTAIQRIHHVWKVMKKN